MDETKLEQNQEKFIEIFNQYITREGADNLLDWLINSDFFTAPASSKFHSAYEGGLCEHSLNVFDRFLTSISSFINKLLLKIPFTVYIIQYAKSISLCPSVKILL